MSLAIQVEEITAVLLADGWHDVADGNFDVDAYEFKYGNETIHGGGQNGITSAGFVFTEPTGVRTAGPLTSILAVQRGIPTPTTADGLVLAEWCGECDGPELEKRWVQVDGTTAFPRMARCPRCNPHAKR